MSVPLEVNGVYEGTALIMPRGRSHASWLRQVESYLRDTGMAGLASVWAMAKRKPKEYRRKVDAATVKNIRDTYQGIWQLT